MSLAIYVHIPFCVKKCNYCDFLSMNKSDDTISEYFKALFHQIHLESENIKKIKNGVVDSIYIGGGTPSFVDEKYINMLMNNLYKYFSIDKNAEITIECNPISMDYNKMKNYRLSGINRISMGLQSIHKNELKLLGRLHSFDDFLHAYENVLRADFRNINVDLIYAIPYQNLSAYEKSLKMLCEMDITHISAYSLIIEENTLFHKLYATENEKKAKGEHSDILCDEELEVEMMNLTEDILKESGYHRYEISNYAKKNFECKHNMKYWNRDDYFGFGIGAASLFKKMRFFVVKDIDKYIKILNNNYPIDFISNNLYKEKTILKKEDELSETMILSLRLINGIDINEVNIRYNIDIEKYFNKEIQKNIQLNLLKKEDDRIFLTKKGLVLANVVMSDFI